MGANRFWLFTSRRSFLMSRRVLCAKYIVLEIVFVVSLLYSNILVSYSNSVEKIETIDQIKEKSEREIEYKNITNQLKLKYKNYRTDFASDEVFANFRMVNTGNLKANILYRGASPIDNSRNRAKYVNDLVEKANVQYIVDLSDSDDRVKKYFGKSDFKSQYFYELYNDNKVCLMHMHTNYTKDDYSKKVVEALKKMSVQNGPYFIHAIEGKNSTGFFCMVLEALTDASYEEIVDDFMKSYENYYGITPVSNNEKYNIIKKDSIDNMLRFIANDNNEALVLKDVQWNEVAKQYLMKNGLSQTVIDLLVNKLSN